MTLRSVLVMLVLAALAVAGWLYLQESESPEDVLPSTVPTFAKGDVSKVTVTFEESPLVLRRRTDRSDAWEVEVGTSALRADANAVDDLLSELQRQEVRSHFASKDNSEADVKDWGLAEPRVRIELTAEGKPVVVRYGKKTREGTGVYVDTGPGTDVWVVGGGVEDHVRSLLASGARSKRLTDLRTYDVGKVEIVRGGVTALEASWTPSQEWRITQPFAGSAEPRGFEQLVNRLVNTDVETWVETDAVDLKKYGLDAPQAEVRLTPKKEGGAATVLLVGSVVEEKRGDAVEVRGVHVMEQGRKAVAVVPKRFLDAVTTDVQALRDRNFTRIGIDDKGLKVKLGTTQFRLLKEGSKYDITEPDRHPTDDPAVQDLLERVRTWAVEDFRDGMSPADAGIAEGGDSIEIERQGGGATTLVFGKTLPDGTRYAQRKDADGTSGVVVVKADVVEQLAKGYPQFRQRLLRPEFTSFMGDLVRIAREKGKSPEGEQVQDVAVERAQDSSDWKVSKIGPKYTGGLDNPALQKILQTIPALAAREWHFWDPSRNEAMGFGSHTIETAQTAGIELEFSGKGGEPTNGRKQVLLIGSKRPEGGYFAKYVSDQGWAFVLGAEDVQALTAPLVK